MSSASISPQVLATRSAEVVEAVTHAVACHILPSWAWLMAEHRRREQGAFRARMVERVLELAAAGEPFTDHDLEPYQAFGAQFARHGVPLRVLTAAFDVGSGTIIRESWRIVSPGHFAEMTEFTGSAARMMKRAQHAAIRAYLEAGRTGSQPRSTRWVLAEALIAGQPAADVAQATGHALAAGYAVMACAVSPRNAGALRGPAVSQAIESFPGTLYCGDDSRLVILIPVPATGQAAGATAAELADRLCSLAGQRVYAAHAFQPGLASIPASLDEARGALCLAMAVPDGERRLYRMDDLLVELAISRQPAIRRRLAGLLAPLEEGTDLRRTLEVLLACNLDRERAAGRLCIHRRTLRYRVDRIRELCGIDPDSVPGLQLLRAALTASRLPADEITG